MKPSVQRTGPTGTSMGNPDTDIIRRVLSGDRKASAELVERHRDRAMTLAVRMLKDRHDAEEALQDAFVRAFRALPGFEQRAQFSTWFYRIVYNVCSDMLARRGSIRLTSIDERDEEGNVIDPADMAETPDVGTESAEFVAVVKKEIGTLEPSYGAILTMFLLQEMSYEEIMEATGLPIGTVKNRLFRARMQLRSAVLKTFHEPTIAER